MANNKLSNVNIVSSGVAIGTTVTVSGVEIKGVQSVVIEPIEANSGEVVALIRVVGASLGGS